MKTAVLAQFYPSHQAHLRQRLARMPNEARGGTRVLPQLDLGEIDTPSRSD